MSVISSPFALIIPGRPLTTSFQLIDTNKLVTPIARPCEVSEFTICILQPTIPANHAIAVYYSLPPFNEWIYIGPVTLSHPSAVFRSPWHGKITDDNPCVQLGLSDEIETTLQSVPGASQREEELAMESAQGIARHLYDFMSSYSQSTGQCANLGDMLVIPTNCIDKWFQKFQSKHRLEPYFWMRKDLTRKY